MGIEFFENVQYSLTARWEIELLSFWVLPNSFMPLNLLTCGLLLPQRKEDVACLTPHGKGSINYSLLYCFWRLAISVFHSRSNPPGSITSSIRKAIKVKKMRVRTMCSWVCNGLITYRKFGAPTASRWRWVGSCMHTRSSARAIDFGRAHFAPQLKVTLPYRRTDVLGAQPLAAT